MKRLRALAIPLVLLALSACLASRSSLPFLAVLSRDRQWLHVVLSADVVDVADVRVRFGHPPVTFQRLVELVVFLVQGLVKLMIIRIKVTMKGKKDIRSFGYRRGSPKQMKQRVDQIRLG